MNMHRKYRRAARREPDPTPAYMRQAAEMARQAVQELRAAGKLGGVVIEVGILHEDGCPKARSKFTELPCTCTPEVRVKNVINT